MFLSQRQSLRDTTLKSFLLLGQFYLQTPLWKYTTECTFGFGGCSWGISIQRGPPIESWIKIDTKHQIEQIKGITIQFYIVFLGLQSNVCCKSEVSLLNILDKENCAHHVSSKRHTALAVQPGLCQQSSMNLGIMLTCYKRHVLQQKALAHAFRRNDVQRASLDSQGGRIILGYSRIGSAL